ncbi:MAG: hypothetical protein IPF57_22850 [Gammaproteobacteria bacterium]|nr:hypothetical protein [Gammaproteobacteria bacterium]
MSEMSDHFGLRVANVFHAGDGNLHPLILFDNSVPGEFEEQRLSGLQFWSFVYLWADASLGAWCWHGKIRQMPISLVTQRCAFHELKHCFDPAGLLNPGKGVPLLKHCHGNIGGAAVRSSIIGGSRLARYYESIVGAGAGRHG